MPGQTTIRDSRSRFSREMKMTGHFARLTRSVARVVGGLHLASKQAFAPFSDFCAPFEKEFVPQ
jgi:hypothetical protein